MRIDLQPNVKGRERPDLDTPGLVGEVLVDAEAVVFADGFAGGLLQQQLVLGAGERVQ